MDERFRVASKGIRDPEGRPAERAPEMIRLAFIGLVVGCGIIGTISFFEAARERGSVLSDFTVFWTAARAHSPYDVKSLTDAQRWLVHENLGYRPFAYPPSTLLFATPLAWAPFPAAAIAWTFLGVVTFGVACALYRPAALLGLLSPLVGVAIIAGQISLFVGSAVVAGIANLHRNQLLGGALLGVAAALKPQSALLVPVALVAGRYWRALGTSTLLLFSIGVASLGLGPPLWPQWIHALPQFAQEVATADYARMNVAPGLWWIPLGVMSVAYVFYVSERPELRLIALVSGGALCVPYLMIYDLAGLAPGAIVLLLRKDLPSMVVGALAFGLFWLAPVIAAGAMFLAYLDVAHGRGSHR